MNIHLNGRIESVDEKIALTLLIAKLGYQNRKIAVELNEEIIPSRLYGETILQENDRLEIVQAIGGG